MLDMMLKPQLALAALIEITQRYTVGEPHGLTLSVLALILAASFSAASRRSSASTSFLLQNSSISVLVMLYTGPAAMFVAEEDLVAAEEDGRSSTLPPAFLPWSCSSRPD